MTDFSNKKRCHHFSFILKKNRVISIGVNTKKTHPKNLINRKVSLKTGVDFSEEKHTCSEFNSILKLKNLTNIDTKKCVLVNIRIDKNNNTGHSKPCMSCENLLKFFEFKKILWTNKNGELVSNEKIKSF